MRLGYWTLQLFVSLTILFTAGSCSLIIDSEKFVGSAAPCANCLGLCLDEGGPAEVCCDRDGDGFFATDADVSCGNDLATDCDDDNIRIFPGAPALCGDGVINDCNSVALPTAFDGLGIQEFQSVGPTPIAEIIGPSLPPATDVLSIPSPYIEVDGVPQGGEFRTLVAYVRRGGDLDLVLYSEVFRAVTGNGFVEVEVSTPAGQPAFPDANVRGVAFGTMLGRTYVAIRSTAELGSIDSVLLAELVFSEPEEDGSGDVVIPAEADILAEVGTDASQSGEVHFAEGVSVSGGAMLEPTAVYVINHGVCRLHPGGREDCLDDADQWFSPGTTRASGFLSADLSNTTFNTSNSADLVLNSGVSDGLLDLKRFRESAFVDRTASWDILTGNGNAEVVVPINVAGAGTFQPVVRFLQVSCPGPLAGCATLTADRTDLGGFSGTTSIVRLAELPNGYAMATVEARTSEQQEIRLRHIARTDGTPRIEQVGNPISLSPTAGDLFDTPELELSSVSDGGPGRTLAVAFATNTDAGLSYFMAGVQLCSTP